MMLQFDILQPYSHVLLHGFLTRRDSNGETAEQQRQRLARFFKIKREQLAIPEQIHSNNIALVTSPGIFPKTDGLLSTVPGVYLTINVADCVPIFIFERVKKIAGIVHAGWRGTRDRIIKKALQRLRSDLQGDLKETLVVLGPSIASCCYEVGSEVSSHFPDDTRIDSSGRIFLDLQQANRRQILEMGVPSENIESSVFCTCCQPELFHSYRRDGGKSGRMIGLIGIKN